MLKSFRFKIRSLLAIILIVSLLLAFSRDIPFIELAHGSFELPADAELSVYEFFDEPHFGQPALDGKWNVNCRWVNRGENHWTPVLLDLVADECEISALTWSEPEFCSVSASITSVTNAKHVRENGAYPISVPWTDQPLKTSTPWLGEYDEFWDMKHSILITDYGVILQAGNGDDGAYLFTIGRDGGGEICAVKCKLEVDPDSWLQNYYSHPRLTRMWWNLLHRLGG